jgi:hypothetical protein
VELYPYFPWTWTVTTSTFTIANLFEHKISAPNSCEVILRTTEGCLAYIKAYKVQKLHSARRPWLIDKYLEVAGWRVLHITGAVPVLPSRYLMKKITQLGYLVLRYGSELATAPPEPVRTMDSRSSVHSGILSCETADAWATQVQMFYDKQQRICMCHWPK